MERNVLVIIRSAHERTEQWCRAIAAAQVPEENVVIIHEKPFSKAVERTFSMGAARNLKWTLALDADILLLDNAISQMVRRAESKPDHTFIYQGCVLDKLFNDVRPGGPHLYRTSLLEKAVAFIPDARESLRPESFTYEKMAACGFHFYQEGVVYGLHDYQQFIRDIYRKSFIHANKHTNRAGDFLEQWRKHNDADYAVAMKAFFDGLSYQGNVTADAAFFETLFAQMRHEQLPAERHPNPRQSPAYVADTINSFLNNDVARRMRKFTKTTHRRAGVLARTLRVVGSGVEKIGRKIKSLSGVNG